MTLDVKRFADAAVIPAVSERATATTLVTAEGRMLTETSLRVRNRAQPIMKVTLPAGATMLSVEVAGETAKPVLGTGGTRVPLLRSGLRSNAPYEVSFVYLHSGQAFAKRGESQMMLPKLDLPVSVLEWELFLPDRYSTKPVAGNVLPLVAAADAPGGGALAETVTVTSEVPYVDRREGERAAERKSLDAVQQSPSQNVINLQRRVAGVLPVPFDVPRTGTLPQVRASAGAGGGNDRHVQVQGAERRVGAAIPAQARATAVVGRTAMSSPRRSIPVRCQYPQRTSRPRLHGPRHGRGHLTAASRGHRRCNHESRSVRSPDRQKGRHVTTDFARREHTHSEGTVARTIEQQTAKLPSDVFLWMAVGSMVTSATLQMMGNRHVSLFVGQWAPTFLILGMYNKLVKQLGSDRTENAL